MTNSFDDKSANNRYGFHSNNNPSTLSREKAGISPEFAHSSVVDPLDKLLRLLGQADKIARATNANAGANKTAIDLLTVCKNNVATILSSNNPQMDNENQQESIRSFGR